MNVLICVGENYRDFLPLNAYAQSVARNHFGTLHALHFCDSIDEMCDTSIFKNILSAQQCLIVLPKEKFNQVIEILQTQEMVESTIINTSCVEICHTKKNQSADTNVESKIYLMDLLSVKNGGFGESLQENLLYLYPLGIDAQSTQILLSGIAKEFGVCIKVLNSHSNLELLSAMNGDLYGFKVAIEENFSHKIFTTFNFAKSVIALLEARNFKITSAESCTGGLIAYQLTKESGASAVFDGGVISYANAIKEAWLEVSAENLARFGAVSEAVVRDMLNGALRLSGADFALATSGIAGPSGGSASKPVGTIYIGVKGIANGIEIEMIECLHFRGDRNFIQAQATLYAYLLFLKIFFENY